MPKTTKIDRLARKEISERIRRAAMKVGSGDLLAEKAEIPRRTLETYLTGQSEPSATRLVSIARAAGVSVEWLATGELMEVEAGEYFHVPFLLADRQPLALPKTWFSHAEPSRYRLYQIGHQIPSPFEGGFAVIDTTWTAVTISGYYLVESGTLVGIWHFESRPDSKIEVRVGRTEPVLLEAEGLKRLSIKGRVYWAMGYL